MRAPQGSSARSVPRERPRRTILRAVVHLQQPTQSSPFRRARDHLQLKAIGRCHLRALLSGIARIASVNRRNDGVLLEVLGPGDVVCTSTLLPDLRHGLECGAFHRVPISACASARRLSSEIRRLQYDRFLLALKRLTIGPLRRRLWCLKSHFVDQTLEDNDGRAARPRRTRSACRRRARYDRQRGLRPSQHRGTGGAGRAPRSAVCLGRFALEGAVIREHRRRIVVPGELTPLLNRDFRPRPASVSLTSARSA